MSRPRARLGLHNSLTLFDLTHGLELGRWRIGGRWLARSGDGATLAVANGSEVSVWRVPPSRLEIVRPTAGHPAAAAFAADGALLVASDRAIAERDPAAALRAIAHHAEPIEVLEPLAPRCRTVLRATTLVRSLTLPAVQREHCAPRAPRAVAHSTAIGVTVPPCPSCLASTSSPRPRASSCRAPTTRPMICCSAT